MAVAMLKALGVAALTLLTSNPAKAAALSAAGLRVMVRGTGRFATPHNRRYLNAKKRHGHCL